MNDPQIVRTLRTKRNDVEGYIRDLERRLTKARRDLAHINATLVIFQKVEAGEVQPYHDVSRLFRRGEMSLLCKAALADKGPMDTRELALHVMAEKGFAPDVDLRKAIAFRIVQAMRMQEKRGLVGDGGRRNAARIWQLAGGNGS